MLSRLWHHSSSGLFANVNSLHCLDERPGSALPPNCTPTCCAAGGGSCGAPGVAWRVSCHTAHIALPASNRGHADPGLMIMHVGGLLWPSSCCKLICEVPCWLSRRPGTAEQFRDYTDAVQRFNVSHFDRVLIDGRARSSCAEHILPWLTNTSLVFWHDFFPVRQHPVPVCMM